MPLQQLNCQQGRYILIECLDCKGQGNIVSQCMRVRVVQIMKMDSENVESTKKETHCESMRTFTQKRKRGANRRWTPSSSRYFFHFPNDTEHFQILFHSPNAFHYTQHAAIRVETRRTTETLLYIFSTPLYSIFQSFGRSSQRYRNNHSQLNRKVNQDGRDLSLLLVGCVLHQPVYLSQHGLINYAALKANISSITIPCVHHDAY